jgi:tetratricopeptide (TPR) repeat protein
MCNTGKIKYLSGRDRIMKTAGKLIITAFAFLALAANAYAQSPREKLQQMVEQLQKTPNDNALREKVIKLAVEINPRPAVMEAVDRHMARGAAGVRTAAKPADFKDAAREFDQAALSAPWHGEAYYNAGIAYSRAGDHSTAISKFKLYLLTEPPMADQKDAKAKIFEEEFLLEKAVKFDSRVMGRWTRMQDGTIFYSLQKRYEDWIIMPKGTDAFDIYRTHSVEKALAPSDQRHLAFNFSVNGEALEGSSSWSGSWGDRNGQLCNPITSRLTGTLSSDGQRLSVKFQMRYKERACEVIEVKYDFGRLQ